MNSHLPCISQRPVEKAAGDNAKKNLFYLDKMTIIFTQLCDYLFKIYFKSVMKENKDALWSQVVDHLFKILVCY